MHNEPQVSLSVLNQIPDFIREEHPLFEEFLRSYYGSLERGSGPVNILNNLPDYFNLSKYDLRKLNSSTNLIGSIAPSSRNIEVESTDNFPDENGTILIDDEVIYYESVRKSPNVVLTPDISYSEFNKKLITLFNPYQQIDGIRDTFDLKANNEPVFPPSARHLLVKLYNEFLIPDVDYTVLGDKIKFTSVPREFDPVDLGDSFEDISIKYLKGFSESTITTIDDIGVINTAIDQERYDFHLRIDSVSFEPSSLSLMVVIVDNVLQRPNLDYTVYGSSILLKNYPTQNSYIGIINAPLLSVGSGFVGYSVVNNQGEVERILVKNGGKNYSIDNTPKVSLVKGTGKNATARALISGVKTITLLEGGRGYSKQNPPRVLVQSPDNLDGSVARAAVEVNDLGQVTEVHVTFSGSGYDFVPRVQFINPSGASVGNVVVNQNGSIVSVDVLSNGIGYTVAPLIYIDDPVAPNGIKALLQGNLGSDGTLQSVSVLTGGTGYDQYNPPRVAVIQPTGAQVLSVDVDSFGRVVNIELLSGGFGYEDIPSVYIVDDRVDNIGNPIGGTGATAVATVFNGEIIDINITNFGEGYSLEEPPKIFISSPIGAKASAQIGEQQITGFEIIEPGFDYVKSEFVGCSRGVSGIIGYDSDENAIFSGEDISIPSIHQEGSLVKGLDSVFLTTILDRIVKQYIPGLPKLDYNTVNIANILRTVKDFYSSKGTRQAISYLFKVLYGVDIDISYPKDQIIKPSAASWSIDTILRAKLISGNPENIRDTSIIQEEDAVDTNVRYAEATVENFIAIQTSDYDVYELVLSEESIIGSFTIPYKTKLAEPMTPETSIITVDSTIGWPERNGEIIVGTEIIRYKEKSLTQFIECTRGINETPGSWDSGTVISSNFYIKANSGTQNEVVMSVLGIVESNNTTLTDESSYYLPGDKLSISKLGSLDTSPLVTSWLYNVKKLIQVESITYGGIGNKTATVTCSNPHGLLVGDQVTVYGANPIVYNGSFLVSARESALVFKYELPQPATLNPQGNILISVDLNKGKSDEQSINSAITNFATNIQNTFFNASNVYVAASGIPNYKIGPFLGTSLLPGNQRKLYRFPRNPQTISLKPETKYGAVGSFINGVSAWNYKSDTIYNYGPVTNVNIINPGSDYDADSPPVLSFKGGGGSGASGRVVVDGSVTSIEVTNQGNGYTTSPLVSISGGKGSGASGTAIITNGKVTRILVNTPGSGYTSAPTITVTGGGGTGCTAAASVRGPIKEVIVDEYGNDYTSAPEVSLSSGEGAAAQSYVSNGRILSIAVIASGNGYTTAPKVTIVGEGYGAVAIANIQTEGSEAGKVTSITILNRGIGYKQGTTQIRLESVGNGAQFNTEIFGWTFNLQANVNYDYANGSIFEGFNKQFGGEYGHVSNPKQLRYVLGDNLTVVQGQIVEKESGIVHSPIIGWAFDGNPIYGPYGLSDPTNLSSTVVPIKSSYVLKSNLVFDPQINPTPVRIDGPSLDEYSSGTFVEDYIYQFRSEQFYLDEYNGRYCKTPEYPEGTYAYFITLNSDGSPAFPYIVGPNFYSIPDSWNLTQFAVQSNIPSGIVRYRAPFENVDIDVDRAPNESTNALTLENGDILTFEVEDENRDGVIDEFEEGDPDQIFEESKLQLFDYFPKIDFSSRVDIEIETTTKFEDAKISGFLIENAGENHQVGDRLIFDDTGTEGYGASAVVSEIIGKNITSYNYEYSAAQDEYFGIVQTESAHNMVIGDIVNVTTVPLMEPTSKSIYVRTIQGLEDVVVVTPGLGYDPEIDIQAVIDSDTGVGAIVEPIVSSTGSLNDVRIINSGRNYLSDPKIRISHPQVQKRSIYFAISRYYDGAVKIFKSITDSSKNTYIVGSVKSSNNDTHGFISKINSEGTVLWSKSLTAIQPGSTKRAEFIDIVKNGSDLYVIGNTYPNTPSADNFNPDLLFAKYTENTSGTSVTLTWQKEAAGISGVLRKDYITGISSINNNIIISGYTTTNSTGTYDGILMYLSPGGDILHKRKLTSTTGTEKLLAIKVDSNDNIYVVGQTVENNLLVAKLRIVESKITATWQKQVVYSGQEFHDITFDIDEYDELFITASIGTTTRNRLALVKLDGNANVITQKEYSIPSIYSIVGAGCTIDVFSDLNVGYSAVDTNGKKTSGVIKLDYKGNVINSYTLSGVEGYNLVQVLSDVSGDPYFVGNIQPNRSQFLYNGNDYTDFISRQGNLTTSGTVSINTDPKWGTNAFTVGQNGVLSTPTLSNSGNWTVDAWIKWDSAATAKVAQILRIYDSSLTDGIKVQLFADNSSPSTLGKWRISNEGATISTFSASTNNVTLLSSGYYYIAVNKSYNSSTGISTYTLYFNGVQQAQITLTNNINPTLIQVGSSTTYNSWPTKIDSFRLSNYAIAAITIPTAAFSGYDYGTEVGYLMKFDKNADAERMGNITLTNNGITTTRTASSISGNQLELLVETYTLGPDGLQVLDMNDTTSYLTQDYHLPSTHADVWSSRTATIPSPGGRKAVFETSAYGKYFFRHFTIDKFDNVRVLEINQDFNFDIGTRINQKNSIGATVGSARIVDIDATNDLLYVTDVSGTFSTNTGYLESSDLKINEIEDYSFPYIDADSPGTFNISIPVEVEATFKNYSDEDYLIRIDEIITGAAYARGSVVSLGQEYFSFSSDRRSVTISGLASVTQITLIANLTKTLQIDAISNTNQIFARSTTSHYLSTGENIYTETAPVYSYADGSFFIKEILSKKEFIFEIDSVPGSFIGSGTQLYVYVKHPVFKFIYGQQYTFDVTHVSNEGYYLSFYRDNLNKIEYTFKNIVRKGIPGRDAPGASPFISFKVTDDVSNISYYADPSRIGPKSPVSNFSYIDVVKSPYIGKFEIIETSGGTVTVGDNKFKFKIDIDPEKNAQSSLSSYSTQSSKVAGSIANIRLVNGGGFYKKLPVITDIQSVRKIERVEIRSPGTEYQPGEYFGVPILGDGAGGKVRITVDENSDPAGQIIEVAVTDPGKGYTEAYIDVDAIDGILGPQLSGSGAVLDVIIPPKGTGSSIFVQGENVGKIKKLKNNNFGFNYTHDYTLRPEITFPVNLQLINTSILSNIKVTDPGTGYTSVPQVVITGGGGSGAEAIAETRNGRISGIVIKNAGFGYSTAPTVELKTSFTYVVNLDLGLFQMAYPHGITNGSEITFTVEDLGEGTAFPLTSFGYIIPGQIYYAIAGEFAGLEDDQLRIALTPQDAESGNYISFANAGNGRQILLTNSFGGAAEAIVETGRFLSGEQVFQGETLETASAIGYVSDNDGWQIGPRILKLINTTGTFSVGQIVNGVISKASGTIDNINAAKGVIEVDSITKTPGKFLDDVGKPNEIVQKIQDSYLYQQFSYNVKSPISIDQWKTTVIDNTHPTGFKIFGEIQIEEDQKGLTDKVDFELTKSVNLVESSVVAHIDNFGLVEPVYKEFDNTQVLFRTKKLTSSEEILTSYVQKIDDIAYLFDGERTSFPLTIDGNTVIANTNQLQLIINGVAQSPGTSFQVQQGSIVFSEAPPAPTKISYARLTLQFLQSFQIEISNVSGILPELGQTIRGLVSGVSATVIESTTSSITVFNKSGNFTPGELLLGSATGLSAQFDSEVLLVNDNIFEFKEAITNTNKKTAEVEEINLNIANSVVTNEIVISKTSGTYNSPSGLLAIGINDFIISAKTKVIAKVISVSPYIDPETGAPISSIAISDPSTFFGLLYNRIVSPDYPNVIIDDISKSSVEIVDISDSDIKIEGRIPEFETINNITAEYTVNSGTGIVEEEFIQNIKINYINSDGDFAPNEVVNVNKLAYKDLSGGNFQSGDIISNGSGYTANVIGVSYALKYLFLGEQTGSFSIGDTISCDRSFVSNDDIVAGRNADASDLILANKLLIADVAVGRMLAAFPGFTVPGGNQNCKDDIVDVLDEICFNLKYGGNHRAYDVGQLYIDNTYLQDERDESVYAFNQARNMAIQAMRNESITIGGYSSLSQYFNLSVEGDQSGEEGVYIPGDCADVAASLTTLFGIVTQAIGSDATPGNLTGITRTNIGTVSAEISAYLEIPFNVEQINTTTDSITTFQYFDDTQHRFRDAANLLRLNSTYIIEETVGRMKNLYPDLIIPGDQTGGSDGTSRCKVDLSLLLNAIIDDLEYGGNYETLAAGRFYLDENGGIRFIARQILQSVYAHQQMSLLCQEAVQGTLSNTPDYTNEIPVLPLDITIDPAPVNGVYCADVVSKIDTLWSLINEVITTTGDVYKDASNALWFNRDFIADEAVGKTTSYFTYFLNGTQYKAFEYPGGNNGVTKCKRDIADYIIPSIIADLMSGGDSNTIDAMTYYIDINDVLHVKDELLPTIYAFEQVNILCQYAIDNWVVTGTSDVYSAQFGNAADMYFDESITEDDGTYGGNCAVIKSAIDALFTKAIDILLPVHANTDTYRDAAKLILFNKEYFKEEIAGAVTAQYPGFNFGGANSTELPAYRTKCKRDIGYIVDAIVYDLLTNGNSAILFATQSYIDAATGTLISLQGELVQTLYAYTLLRTFMKSAIRENLTSPSPNVSFYSYTDNNIAITAGQLTTIDTFLDNRMSILLGTLNNSNYIESNEIVAYNAINVPSRVYPSRIDITGISGRLSAGDYIYGQTSGIKGEIESIFTNRATIKKTLKRVRINFTLPLERFIENDAVTVQGSATNNGIVYSYSYSENFNYIDVDVNSGSFTPGDILINGEGYTATVVSVTDKVQISKLIGEFSNGDKIREFGSSTEFTISNYSNVSAPVLDNTGSKLTLETESYFGNFNVSNVIYSNTSDVYIDVKYNLGTQVGLGDLVLTKKIYKLEVVLSDPAVVSFPLGNQLQDSALLTTIGTIVAFIPNDPEAPTTAEIYVGNLEQDFFTNGSTVNCYESGNNFPIGIGTVTSTQEITSEAYGFIEKIDQVGEGYRIYLSSVKGTFNPYAQLLGRFGYKSLITDTKSIVGRVSRSFRGFDGVQDTFDLTINNGTSYLPNPDGHMLVFLNGVLQPPTTSYSAFSDVIQFTEPPELGASFHAVYIGKLRQLDDIGFEFDSLRNSFNLKLDEVFYSLTVTAGSEASNIKPENNIIISLNGIIQEPGVAFELVGSRVIFAEIPRAGSSFVAFSYIGSDADVIASEVVPPIESGDELLIEGEDQDRTVAIIESSNSLVTFDYTGSVFGRNASALVSLIKGRITELSVTSTGNGYTSRPTVSIDSTTGFDGQIKALVGVSRVDVVDRGGGYKYPEIEIINDVSDTPALLIFDSTGTFFDTEDITFDQA